jgi:hydroxyacylglutathione hydrolase
MYIEQLYTNCLAEAAYYIESDGEAAIIDPLREPMPYMEKAKERNATIKYVLETHFHADFVSGHVDLAEQTGAKIVFGPTAQTGYDSHIAKDGEIITIGKIKIKVLHTPGHTPESSCYLLLDENDKEHSLFTGDTLFVGDVGRPDLAVSENITQKDLAGMLYDSLRDKILTLSDNVIVYPAHGAGSACGKNIGKETYSTIGEQKKYNYALQPMSKEDFVAKVTEGISTPPDYFFKDAMLNKNGYASFENVLDKSLNPLSVNDVKNASGNYLILDTRASQVFAKAHILSSLNIGLGGQYAIWAATIIEDMKSPIIIIADPGKEKEAIMRLARVGFENVIGYLDGGFASWQNSGNETAGILSVPAEEFVNELKKNNREIIDVRKQGEYDNSHLETAKLIPLDGLLQNLNEFDKSKSYYVHCAGGYRSMIACSLLKARGYSDVIDVAGGFSAIEKTGVPVVSNPCQV